MPNPWDNDPVVGAAPTAPQGDAGTLGRMVIRKGQAPQGLVVKDRYIVDPNTATAKPIAGLPADAGDDEPGLDPTAASFYAQQILAGGQMPALGMGKAAAKARQEIMNEVARISGAQGKSGTDLAKQVAHYKAGQKQVSTLENQLGTTQQNEQTAMLNGQQFMDRSAELPGQTSIPLLNSVIQTAQRHLPVPGHETIAAMDAAWNTFVNEYAKVVSGTPSGGGTLSDSARHEAMQTMQGNYSLEQKKAAFQQMQADMANRLTAMNGTIDQAYDNLTAEPGHRTDRQDQHVVAPMLGTGGATTPPPGGPENPIANGGPGDMGPTLTPSDGSLSSLVNGSTRSVIDPKKQALGQQIVSLVSKGAPPNVIMGFAVGADPTLRSDPKFHAWVSQAIQYRQQHPHAQFSIDPSFYTSEVPLSIPERIGDTAAQSGPGAAAMNAANAVTAGNLGNITGDKEGVDRALAVANAQHPMASLGGTAVGGATAALGLEGMLAKAGVPVGLGSQLTADAGYGAAAGATNSDNPLTGAVKGGIAGLLGSVAGRGIGKAAGGVAEGVTAPTVSYVARETPGALTIGQAVGQSGVVGKAVKGVEDRLSGIPVVGDAINARRLEGLQKMNSKAFDKALEPIKETAAGQFGEQAVQDAQDKVSQAFSKALGGKVASVDHGFITDAAKAKSAIKALPPSISKDVENHIDTAIKDYVDPNSLSISGENMQALLRDLQQVKNGYRSDPAGHRVGKAIDQMTASIENLFRRQAPDVMPQYDAAKQAFKRVSTLEDAVLKAKNESDGKNAIFTPAQLGMADKANTIKFGGKHAAAAGKGDFHDFQRAMQSVLPNKVPDSGTVGRAVVLPALALGAGATGGELSGNETTGLTLGGLIAAAYTRTGQRALTAAVLKRGAAAKSVGQGIKKAVPALGHAGGSVAALGTSRD